MLNTSNSSENLLNTLFNADKTLKLALLIFPLLSNSDSAGSPSKAVTLIAKKVTGSSSTSTISVYGLPFDIGIYSNASA